MVLLSKALVLAALLAACGGGEKMGSIPIGGMGSTGGMGAGPEDAGAEPIDPMGRPLDKPLVLRFAYSLSEELSCSQSFESDGWSAKYELVVEPSGAATLGVSSDRSHSFGPSMARFNPGMEDETTREQSGSDRTWRGIVDWKGFGFSVALEPDKAECKSLVAGKGWYLVECPKSAPLQLTCDRETVQALPPLGAATPQGEAETPVEVAVFRCTPPYGLPAAGEIDEPLPDALPFSAAPGLELEYWRHGIGNFDTPKLRLLPPETPEPALPE